MVCQFVNNDMGNEFAKPDIATFNPFVEDRQPVQANAVGRLGLVKRGFFSQRLPVIDSGERVRAFDLKGFRQFIVGQFVNRDFYVRGNCSIRIRQSLEGKPNQPQDVVAGWRNCVLIGAGHGKQSHSWPQRPPINRPRLGRPQSTAEYFTDARRIPVAEMWNTR